jgi:hypothetical protein
MPKRARQESAETGEPQTIADSVGEVIAGAQAAQGAATDFDPAKLERQTPAREPGDDTEAEQSAGAQVRHGITKRGFPKVPERPADPFGSHTISLTAEPDGLRARFLRSNEHGDVWIQFSENPGKQYTQQLDAEGFRWESRARSDFAKGAWVLDLEPGQEWRNHARAEQVFLKVVNQIREANGLDEFVPMAGKAR